MANEVPLSNPMTKPEELPRSTERHEKFVAATAVSTGVASKYWLELKAYPPGSARSLWLFVDGAWRHLDDSNVGAQDSVQQAFCNCPDKL
jgi:hypothetical protein